MNAIEGNKLIAEFMGAKIDPLNTSKMKVLLFPKGTLPYEYMDDKWPEEILLFHSSWDWLMKVVEKIESIRVPQIAYGFELNMLGKRCVTIVNVSTGKDVVAVGIADYNENIFHTKIEAAWLVVIEFIKWYNEWVK